MEKIKFKARASKTSILLSEPQAKKDKEAGKLSKSCIKYLEEWAKEHYCNRRPMTETDAMSKGTDLENESLLILNARYGTNYKKDDILLENEWMTGHRDIVGIDHVRDLKTCKTYSSFPLIGEVSKENSDQINSYLWLSGPKFTHGFIDKVATNSPDWMVNKQLYYCFNDIKARFGGEMNQYAEEEYEKKAYEIFKDHVFDDTVSVFSNGSPMKLAPEDCLTLEQRVRTFRIERDEELISRIPVQVEKCRIWLKKNGY